MHIKQEDEADKQELREGEVIDLIKAQLFGSFRVPGQPADCLIEVDLAKVREDIQKQVTDPQNTQEILHQISDILTNEPASVSENKDIFT